MKKFDGLLLGCDMDGTLLDSRKTDICEKPRGNMVFCQKTEAVFRSQQGAPPRAIDIISARCCRSMHHTLI